MKGKDGKYHVKEHSFEKLIGSRAQVWHGTAYKTKGNLVKTFKEKPQLQKGWISGGFFVIEPSFLKFIGNKNEMLERNPINQATKKKALAAYKHNNFWFCMDTIRDKISLENMIKKKKAPWL